jgi:hypothetical protein
LGVYEVSIKKIAFETGIDKLTVEKALKRFERDGKIKYAVNRVILYNYLKHQSFNFNMKKSAIDCYNNLPIELKDNDLPKVIERSDKGFETLCEGFGMVRKIELELEVELEVEEEEEINILFDVFWQMYPKKENKQKCLKSWIKLKDIDREKIIETLPNFLRGKATQYIPAPERYFSKRRWEDVVVENTNITSNHSRFTEEQIKKNSGFPQILPESEWPINIAKREAEAKRKMEEQMK